MTALRVVVAARSGLRRAATARLLQDAGLEVTGDAADADDLLRKVRAHQPDVAIAELTDTHREWVRAVRTIRRELPGVGMLLISRYVEAQHVAALLEPGAEGAGYLLEERVTGIARFLDAVREVAASGSVLDAAVVTRLLAPEPLLDDLSQRDREVLAQMAAGATNRTIARRMFLSERAIERHVTSIFHKLGIAAGGRANRRVLAVLAYLGAVAYAA